MGKFSKLARYVNDVKNAMASTYHVPVIGRFWSAQIGDTEPMLGPVKDGYYSLRVNGQEDIFLFRGGEFGYGMHHRCSRMDRMMLRGLLESVGLIEALDSESPPSGIAPQDKTLWPTLKKTGRARILLRSIVGKIDNQPIPPDMIGACGPTFYSCPLAVEWWKSVGPKAARLIPDQYAAVAHAAMVAKMGDRLLKGADEFSRGVQAAFRQIELILSMVCNEPAASHDLIRDALGKCKRRIAVDFVPPEKPDASWRAVIAGAVSVECKDIFAVYRLLDGLGELA